nr:MAG TPA: hypothetical protein [Caudoviricetes sp.]
MVLVYNKTYVLLYHVNNIQLSRCLGYDILKYHTQVSNYITIVDVHGFAVP